MENNTKPHLPIIEYLRAKKRLKLSKNYQFEDLRSRTFKNASFAGIDLRGADLSAAKFYSCNFSRADLSAATLNGTLFDKCNLEGCKMVGTIKNAATKFNQCTGEPILIDQMHKGKLKEGRYKTVMAKVLKERKDKTPITAGAPVIVKNTPIDLLRLSINKMKK
jgi:uncharacterized protein YjbI with pentapeptide repeats